MSNNFTQFIVANHIQSFFILIVQNRVNYARVINKCLDWPPSVKTDQ